MKLDSPEFRELFTPELMILSNLFEKNNVELRIAGGAVRDLLMGIKPADVDFATTATPTEMKDIFEKEGIRMLHKRGEEHGTITCRINDMANFEITTLRVDVVCDGRRAEVEYTKDWQLDANRRDLTINSLFLDLQGNVIDYFGGIEDVYKRRVAFVGDAGLRIQEDYLRILRYFRFFGRISATNAHEDITIDAIKKYKDGLTGVSAERIWTELKKIVVGRMAGEVVQSMLDTCGLAPYLGLPDDYDMDRFLKVYEAFPNEVEPMTMISCLCRKPEEVEYFHQKTKLSNAERDLAKFLIVERQDAELNKDNMKWWRIKIADLKMKPGAKKDEACVLQLARSILADKGILKELSNYNPPTFPLNGSDLLQAKIKKGPRFGVLLLDLYEEWKRSDFQMTKEELLNEIPNILNDIPTAAKRMKIK